MATYSLGLLPGLNVVSIPLIVSDSLTTLLSSTAVVEVKRIIDGVWQSFIPTRSFNDFDNLDPQYGYLITTPVQEVITITGTEPVSTIYSLNGELDRNNGLNLIGVPISAHDIAIEDYFVDRLTLEPFDIRTAFSHNALRQRFSSYIPIRPGYMNFTLFERGKGYVVMSDQTVEIEIEY